MFSRGEPAQRRRMLAHPELAEILDLSRPVALLLVAVLHFIRDDDEVRCWKCGKRP